MKITVNLSDGILFITFCALLWYTWETRKMRIATQRQTKVAITPMISIVLEKEESSVFGGETSSRLFAKNAGEGTGINIEVKPLRPLLEDSEVSFLPVDILSKGESKELVPNLDLKLRDIFINNLFERSNREDIFFKLECKNIFRDDCGTKILLRKGIFLSQDYVSTKGGEPT